MSELVHVCINGRLVQVAGGTSVAAALIGLNVACHTSITGEERGPLCGMGICYECRLTINGVPARLACQTVCTEGMEVRTNG